MIYSPSKREAQETRLLLLEAMELCIRTGHIDDAKVIGEASKRLSANAGTNLWPQYEALLKSGVDNLPTYAEWKATMSV